jgi:plastocyanin
MLQRFRPFIVLLVLGATSSVLSVQGGTAQTVNEENETSLEGNKMNMSGAENKMTMSSTEVQNNTIILNVAEVGDEEQYRWVNSSGAENPTLSVVANKEYTIKISNPTDEEHQLIIDSKAEDKTSQIAKSKEIKPEKNVEFNFKTDQIGELGYHCKYHPDMMNGTITVTG